MKTFKKFIAEAFNKKPQTEAELEEILAAGNMLDWFPFLKLVWKGFGKQDKNLMSWEIIKVGKGKGVSGKNLGLKVQPGLFYLLTMDAGAKTLWKKMWPKLEVSVDDSGAEPKLWLGKKMKWSGDGEEYEYSMRIISGLGSGAKKAQMELNGNL